MSEAKIAKQLELLYKVKRNLEAGAEACRSQESYDGVRRRCWSFEGFAIISKNITEKIRPLSGRGVCSTQPPIRYGDE